MGRVAWAWTNLRRSAAWAFRDAWVAMLLHVAIAIALWGWVVDDAAITFGYARNLLEGHGIVTYAQGPRVEGYSNPTYLVLYTAFAAAGGDSAYVFAGTTSLVFGLAALAILARLLAGMGVPRVGAQVLLAIAALSPPWVFWMNSGLEGPLEVLLLAILFVGITQSRLGLLVTTAALLVLTRPEGVLVVLGFASAAALLGRHREARRLAMAGLLVFAAATAFRLAYFGTWMPNPYFAKETTLSAARTGIDYLLGEFGSLPLAVLLGGYVLGLATAGRRELPYLAAGMMVAQLVVIVKAGGDSMHGGRFLLPLVPGLVLGAGGFLTTLTWAIHDDQPSVLQLKRVVAAAAVVALVGLSAGAALDAKENLTVPTAVIQDLGDEFHRLALELGIAAPLVMNPDLGGIMDRRLAVVDLGRLGDPVLAHGVPATPTPPHAPYPPRLVDHYVVAHQRPDLVESHGAWTAASGILRSTAFHDAYSLLGGPVEDLGSGRFMAVSDETAAIAPSLAEEPYALVHSMPGIHSVFVVFPMDLVQVQGNVTAGDEDMAFDLALLPLHKQHGGTWSRTSLVARTPDAVTSVTLAGIQLRVEAVPTLTPTLLAAYRIHGVGLQDLQDLPELDEANALALAREHRRQGMVVPDLPGDAPKEVRFFWEFLEGGPTPSEVRRYTRLVS